MQFIAPLKEEFRCKICHEPWDPECVLTCADCEAVFCHACHQESMAKGPTCLSCGKTPAVFKTPHRLLVSMANNLEVFCPNRCHGCGWQGPRSGFATHVSACTKRPKEFTYVDEGAIADELKCPICHDVLVEPAKLPCDHVFCRKCVTQCLAVSPCCPIDRAAATLDDVSGAPKFLLGMLDELQVFCVHRNSNPSPCPWTGRRRDFLGHRTTCAGGRDGAAVAVSPTPDATVPAPTAKSPPPPPAANSAGATVEVIAEFPTVVADDLSQDVYVLAHVTAPKLESVDQRRKPLAVSAVIDVSGSMSGSKLKMAIESLEFMINELSERDSLGIVAFQSTITEICPVMKMSESGKRAAREAAHALRADGCTNLSGGLQAGIDQLNGRRSPAVMRSTKAPPAVRPSSGGIPNLLRRMMGAAGASTPARPVVAFDVVVWCSPMRRNGKTMYSYSADVKIVAGPASALQYVSLSGRRSLPQTRAEFSGASSLSLRWEAVEVAEDSLRITIGIASLYGEPEKAFVMPLPNADQAQATARFTIPSTESSAEASISAEASGAVLLFTDGAANEGISNPSELQTAFRSWLANSRSVVLHTFGFGADHNAALLQQLSEIGGGSYYYIENVDSMKTSFADCLGGLVSTVMENVTLTVTANAGFRIDRVMTTLKLDANGPGGAHTVTIRDMYSEETRDVLIKLKLTAAVGVGISVSPVSLALRYDSLITGAKEVASAVGSLLTSAVKCAAPPNVTLDQQRARILVTEAIEAARKEADSGRVEAAQRLMVAAKAQVASATSACTPYMQQVAMDCDALVSQTESATKWAATGSKQAAQMQNCHAQQRWNSATECCDAFSYDNAFKKEFRGKSKK